MVNAIKWCHNIFVKTIIARNIFHIFSAAADDDDSSSSTVVIAVVVSVCVVVVVASIVVVKVVADGAVVGPKTQH